MATILEEETGMYTNPTVFTCPFCPEPEGEVFLDADACLDRRCDGASGPGGALPAARVGHSPGCGAEFTQTPC